ncbi:MAG: hypothetical protein RLZ32_727, partial [Gemmatimonadota bacterium]
QLHGPQLAHGGGQFGGQRLLGVQRAGDAGSQEGKGGQQAANGDGHGRGGQGKGTAMELLCSRPAGPRNRT